MMKFIFTHPRRVNDKTRPSSSKTKSPPDFSSRIPSYASTTSTSEENTKFEYDSDASRDEYTIAPSEVDISNKYGYEDCSPSEAIASKYDYGETPAAAETPAAPRSESSGTPRRSSMKHGEGNAPRFRRASIGYSGEK
jgi:hypothetical protein